jgi:hypothetical protein
LPEQALVLRLQAAELKSVAGDWGLVPTVRAESRRQKELRSKRAKRNGQTKIKRDESFEYLHGELNERREGNRWNNLVSYGLSF